MKKLCIQCSQSFEAKRADARFCSNVCRAHYHNDHKGRQTQPVAQQTQLPMYHTPVAQPIPPQNYGLFGLEDPRMQKLQDKIETLQAENRRLEIDLLEARANAKIESQIAKFKADMEPEPPSGLAGLVDSLTGNERLMNLAEKFIEARVMRSEGAGDGNVFSGLEGDRRDKLHALVEISKTLDDNIVDVLLGIAGKASADPEGFIQGIQEATATVEHQATKHFLP